MHAMGRSAFCVLLAALAGCGARTGLESGAAARDAAAPDEDVVAPMDDVVLPIDFGPVEDITGEEVAPDTGVDGPPDVVRDVPPPRDVGPICGNARVEPGEECDLGADNLLLPAFAVFQVGLPRRPVSPVARRVPIATFYDYRSASAHTGFEDVGVVNVMLYVNATNNDLGMVFLAGRDGDLGGASRQPDAEMRALFRGVPSTAALAVSDDPTANGEFARNVDGSYEGRWSFLDNTDGGAIAALPWGAPWTITVTTELRAGLSSMRYVDTNARFIPVMHRDALVIEHRVSASRCRPDCRLPRCGDGFVDGGERCDDGNARSGDGCAADCQRIE